MDDEATAARFLRQERFKFTVSCLIRSFKSWYSIQSVNHSPEPIAPPDLCAATTTTLINVRMFENTRSAPTPHAPEQCYLENKDYTGILGDNGRAVESVETRILNTAEERLFCSQRLQNDHLGRKIAYCRSKDSGSSQLETQTCDDARFAWVRDGTQQNFVPIGQTDSDFENDDHHSYSSSDELCTLTTSEAESKVDGARNIGHPRTRKISEASRKSNPSMECQGNSIQNDLNQCEKELLSSTYLSRKAARGASARESKAAMASQLAVARLAAKEEKKKAGLAVSEEFAASEIRKEELRKLRKSKAAMLKAEKRKINSEEPKTHDSVSEGTTGSVKLKFDSLSSAQFSDKIDNGSTMSKIVQNPGFSMPIEVDLEGKADIIINPVKKDKVLNTTVQLDVAARSKEVQFSSNTEISFETGKLFPEDDMLGDGRIVWNHSTHLPGLMKVLQKLRNAHQGIKTIVAGRISTGLAHRPTLQLEEYLALQPPVLGFTCVARIESSRQEVMFVTEEGTCIAAIISAVQNSCSNGFRSGPQNQGKESFEMGLSNPNRDWSKEDERKRKAAQKALHEREKQAQRNSVDSKNADDRKRKLRASGAAKEKGYDMDAAAKTWADAATHGVRGRNWGK